MADNRAIARRKARKYFGPKGQALFMAQMGQEAGFKTGLTSSAGAQGPAQIMPATAKAWGVRNVNDPEEAYEAAARNMAKYLKAYGGNWNKALTAYNAGPGRVGGPLPAETQHYIKTIRANAGQYASGTGPQSPGARTGGRVPGETLTQTTSTFDAAGYQRAMRRARIGQLIAKRNPQSSLVRLGLLGGPAPEAADFSGTQTTTTKIPGMRKAGGGGGGSSSGGGFVGSDVKELFWNGPGAANIKDGRTVGKGFVSGHTDHVHVAAGPKTILHLAGLAEKYGLRVGENPAYEPVDPVHATGSYHYRTKNVGNRKVGMAIDVSGDTRAMARYAAAVKRYQRKKGRR